MRRALETPGNLRIRASLGVLVVFGALFVLPLCAALALCTMPCCHHDDATASVGSGAMAACETECGIRSAEMISEIPALAPENTTRQTSPIAVLAHFPPAPAAPVPFERDSEPSCRAAEVSLHVLNSVFRI